MGNGWQVWQQDHSGPKLADDRDRPSAVLAGISPREHSSRWDSRPRVGGLSLLSALWSIDPQTTIRRGVLYVFFVIGVIGVAGNLDGDEFMDLLGVTCLLAAAASIVLLVISPSDAITPVSNELRGIFPIRTYWVQSWPPSARQSPRYTDRRRPTLPIFSSSLYL